MNASLIQIKAPLFIRAGEGLITKTTDGEYIGQSGPFSKAQVLHYTDDKTLVVYHDRGEDGVRDITEDTACDFLDAHPDYSPYEEEFVPPYVRNSIAWSKHIESYVELKRALSLHANSAGRSL